jgi:hypothetical protein
VSASTAIGDVTETLQALLTDQQRPLGTFAVSLQSPAEEPVEAGNAPRINLFLLRVTPNPHSRNPPWTAEGTGALRFPPLALNLYYVVTPFATNQVDEHRVLGEAMRILHDHATLAGAALRGSLANTTEEFRIELAAPTIEDLTRIWSAFARPYRLTVCYEAQVVVIDSETVRPVVRVTGKEDVFTQI